MTNHGPVVHPPQNPTYYPDRSVVEWHVREVFQGRNDIKLVIDGPRSGNPRIVQIQLRKSRVKVLDFLKGQKLKLDLPVNKATTHA